MGRVGQSLSEYALVGTMVVVALVTMSAYIRRGMQAHLKLVADNLLAISEEDATVLNAAQRGKKTQKLGLDERPPGTGFNHDIVSVSTVKNSSRAVEIDRGTGLQALGRQEESSRESWEIFVGVREIPPRFVLRRRDEFELPKFADQPDARSTASPPANERLPSGPSPNQAP